MGQSLHVVLGDAYVCGAWCAFLVNQGLHLVPLPCADFCGVFEMANESFLSDQIKNGPCSLEAEVFQIILRLHYKLYQSIAHSSLDLDQIYAPEKILFLHDLDKKCV